MTRALNSAPAGLAQGEAAPVDFLTVLTCEPDHLLTKTWIADDAIIPSTRACIVRGQHLGAEHEAQVQPEAHRPGRGLLRQPGSTS